MRCDDSWLNLALITHDFVTLPAQKCLLTGLFAELLVQFEVAAHKKVHYSTPQVAWNSLRHLYPYLKDRFSKQCNAFHVLLDCIVT